jgi:hypothetical protein
MQRELLVGFTELKNLPLEVRSAVERRLIERGVLSFVGPLPEREGLWCGHPSTSAAVDEFGVEICKLCSFPP